VAAKKKATKAAPKRKPKAAEVEEETTVSTNERRLEREPTAMHHRLAAYIEEQTGYEPDVKTVQLVSNMRNEWRKSEDYVAFKAEQAEESGEEAPKPKAKKAAPKRKPAAKKAATKKKAAPKRKPKAAAEDDPFDD
jgi:colicin import membrane protein